MVHLDCSEFGDLWLAHGHHGLHVRLEERWYNRLVKTGAASSFKLLLVDITVVVSDRRWNMLRALRECFKEWDHLWSYQAELFLITSFKKATCTSLEETRFIE